MNNVVYGKTMESLRNRIDVSPVKNEQVYLKCTSKPSEIFDNKLLAIQKSKTAIKLNKPAYIEIRILKLGKALMYEYHHDDLKNKNNNKPKLLFKDIDSLMYEIKTEDVSEKFSSDKEMFDFNNYSTKSKYYDNLNKLLIGKMKGETGGVVILLD